MGCGLIVGNQELQHQPSYCSHQRPIDSQELQRLTVVLQSTNRPHGELVEPRMMRHVKKLGRPQVYRYFFIAMRV